MQIIQAHSDGSPYGTGKSKYVAYFRTLSGGLSALSNVATFKLIPKSSYKDNMNSAKGLKGKGATKYLTLASAGSIELDDGKKSALAHSERNIGNSLEDHGVEWVAQRTFSADGTETIGEFVQQQTKNHRDLSFKEYWIGWIYSERIPCHSDNYHNCCNSYLTQLHARQVHQGGPDFACYYSFGLTGNVAEELGSAIAKLPKLVVLSNKGNLSTILQLDVAEDREYMKGQYGV